MGAAKIPENEQLRIQVLRGLNVLDTASEERFDRITRMAKTFFNVPIALVSLVDEDRQWFKSVQGLSCSETSRDSSFCAHAIHSSSPFVVPDTQQDSRFQDNELVVGEPKIRFYAGYPIEIEPNVFIGTLCVIDNKPRQFSGEDLATLSEFGEMVKSELLCVTAATTDPVTGLTNMRGFSKIAEYQRLSAKRDGRHFGLLFVNLDNLDDITNKFSEIGGCKALKRMGSACASATQQSEIVARIRGSLFGIMSVSSDPNRGLALKNDVATAISRQESVQCDLFDLRHSASWHDDSIEHICSVEETLAHVENHVRINQRLPDAG